MGTESPATSPVSWESDLIGAATAGNYLPIKRWVDNTLRIPCEEVKRCSPMNASLAGKMLRIAALNGKVAIVDLLRSYAYVNERGNEFNQEWTALHCAVMGFRHNSVKRGPDRFVAGLNCVEDDQLLIIYMLHESGAQVTTEANGDIPLTLALDPEVKFYAGAVLLEKLQQIQCKTSPTRINEIPESMYLNCVQNLVQWATVRQYTDLVMHILKQYKGITKLINKFLLLNSNEATVFHIVAEIGNHDFMCDLINVCWTASGSITPEHIANWQCKHVLPSNPENGIDTIEMYQTPLSLAIGKDHLAIIDAIKISDTQLCSVTYLSLSNVCIKTIPLEVFTFPCIKVLDLSTNMLRELPLNNSNIADVKIVEINLSHNRFAALPDALFALPMLESLKATSNALANVPSNWWKASKLQRLDLSGNRIMTIGREPTFSDELYFEDDNPATATTYQLASSHVEFRLQQRATLHSVCINRDNSVLTVLRLNDNMIELFPRGLACLTPKLESLHLVNNSIKNICPIEELPPKLRILDISHNYLTSQTGVVFQPGKNALPCFRAPKQCPVYCHHMVHNKLFNLGSLNFNHNDLECLSLFDREQNLLFPKLFCLNISYNKFTELPLQLYRFPELRLLNISNNPTVRQIPLDIGNISTLIDLEYNNIGDPLVETLDTIPSIIEKLTYLRTLQQSSEKNSIIRLMMVGPSGHGKTTLLSHLKSKNKAIPQPVTFLDRQLSYSVNASAVLSKSCNSLSKSDLQSTVGIDIDTFFYEDCSAMSQQVVFSAWDFAGQEEYFITHHCFISPGAVYVVCCKTQELFDCGASILLPWLAMIKAKAPGSPILIVGTFIDKLSRKSLKQCDMLRSHIMEHFASPTSSLQVEIEDVVFVECSSRRKRPCIALLRRKLYESAFNVIIPPGPNRRNHLHVLSQQKLLNQLVPTVYTELHKKLAATAAHIRRHLSTQQPVFTWDELKDTVSDVIEDEMDLHSAVEYLKRNGSLIHFDTDGLQHLYFIDPQWLIDKLALVVTTPNRSILSELSGHQHPEIINTRSLMRYLFEYGFLPVFQDAFCELLSRFELAIPIGDGSRLFFPSLLLTHSEFRYFKMHYSFPRNCDIENLESELTDNVFGSQVTAEHSLSAPINVILRPTGLCYRRFFVLTVVPIPLWPRLISRCLTTLKFLEIIKKNCVSSLPFQLFQEFGKTRVGNTILEWIYWMNGIELRLSDTTLLQISSVDFTRCDSDVESISMQTHMKHIFINNGNQWLQLPTAFSGGLEVVVPEYLLLSVGSCPGQSMVSNTVSAQIFTHCIEVIDEIFVEWFTSSSSGSDIHAVSRYLVSFTPCPICAGDKDYRTPGKSPPPSPPPFEMSMSQQSHSASVESNFVRSRSRSQSSVSSWFTRSRKPSSIFDLRQPEVIAQVNKLGYRYVDSSDTIGPNPVGFTIMHCLWIAQYQDYVYCPKHGKLELMYLAPDLVYADAKDFIIPNDQLSRDVEVIGQGGFGKILKKQLKIRKYNQTFDEVVAIKILSEQTECTPENILHQYNDSRRELNMIYGLDHERIVRFYGITLQPVGFVMEWAGLGSLDDVIKKYHSHGLHVCPDCVFAVTKQVVTGLGYLHGLDIVHFDLKPQNILIFKFPRETHCCYPQTDDEATPTSHRCVHCYNEAGDIDGVVIKLADLGISVRKGPRGFVRSCATPGHTAPEALLHRGLKHLNEKVDIFSLGMCMYETMSLALVPPKEYDMFEFDEEIKNGIRPGFLEKDPRYPVFLYDCMTSCWDQNPQVRPSTDQLLDIMTPMKLQLVDFFAFNNYKISDIQCSCVVFSEESNEESLWLAMNEQCGMTTLLVVKFQVQESKIISKVISPISFIGKVVTLCQVQQFVYVILEGVKVATIHSQTFEQLDMVDNPFNTTINENLCTVCYIEKLHVLLMAFTGGTIGVLRLPHNGFNLTELTSQFQYEVISSIGKKGAHIHHLDVDCHFICMEQVIVNGDTDELWIGCDNDTIITLPLQVLLTEATPEVRSLIRNVSSNSDCPCKVVQLKSVEVFKRQLVYALLDVGVVVCYDVSVAVQDWQCLKQISIPSASVMLVHGTKLYLGTRSGQIFYLKTDTLITDKVNTHKPLLCGKHQDNQPVFDLVTVTGQLSPHNFLQGLGTRSHQQLNKPCEVMLSIGGGYTELLPSSESTMNLINNDLCIIATLL